MTMNPRAVRAVFQIAAPGAEELDWQEHALCAEVDPAIFFPEKGESSRPAKRVCAECEVRAECLDYALERGEPIGIWGGATTEERRRIKRQRAAAIQQPKAAA